MIATSSFELHAGALAPRAAPRPRRLDRRPLAPRPAGAPFGRAGRPDSAAPLGCFSAAAVLEPARLPAVPLEGPATTRPSPTSRTARIRCTASAGCGRGRSCRRARSRWCCGCRHAGDADWPFAFEATQYFTLTPRRMSVQMVFTNRATIAQPVGLGWHPVLPAGASAAACTSSCPTAGMPTSTQLPIRKVAQPGIDSDVAHLDFDNCFEGWRGPARIRDEKLLAAADSSLAYLVVFTPPEARLFLRRAGQPRQQRDPHGRPGRARPAQRSRPASRWTRR